MARTATEDRRVVVEGAAMGGATAEALTAGVMTVKLVSMVKFLRLLKMQLTRGRKKTKTIVANGSKNRNPKIVGWQFRD